MGIRLNAMGLMARAGLALVMGVALAMGSVGGFAQGTKTMLVVPPAPLLPATLGKLTRVAEGDAGDGLGVLNDPEFDKAFPAERAVLLEDGLKRFARSAYTEDGKALQDGGRTDRKQSGTVTVYQFGDVSGAVSAFDYFRSTEKGRVDRRLGDAASVDRQGVVFRSGADVVREDFDRGGEALMQELIVHLPKVSGPAALSPLLPTYLPAKGLETESVRYALGPAGYEAMSGVLPSGIVGFDKAGETVTARYMGKGTLTLLLYPTPQIAGDHGRQILAEMNKPGVAQGTVMLRREGPLVLLTSGMWTAGDAKAMIESIHLRNELSWDKKMPLEFHAEVQKTYSLLTSIAVFCGVGALAAVILGLFLGGGRAAIRVLQGKPAATEPEFLSINLRGKAAPIHLEGSGPGQHG
jgi:hypothetical protein